MARERLNTRKLTLAIALAGMLAAATGCGHIQASGSSRAGAPALQEEGSVRTGHNVADPNAPFTMMPAVARLATREPLLDVNGVPACAPAALGIFESRSQANGPHHTARFTVENSGEACRLGGFPAITLLESNGTVLGNIHIRKVSAQSMAATLGPAPAAGMQAASDPDEPSPEILLTARGQAAFELGWTAGSTCEQVARIAIAAPGSTATITIPRMLSVCEDQVLLTAVSPAGVQ